VAIGIPIGPISGLLDLYRRSTFVIDAAGIVRYAHRYLNAGTGYQSTPDLLTILSQI